MELNKPTDICLRQQCYFQRKKKKVEITQDEPICLTSQQQIKTCNTLKIL